MNKTVQTLQKYKDTGGTWAILAKRLGCSISLIHKYLQGEIEPKPQRAEQIEQAVSQWHQWITGEISIQNQSDDIPALIARQLRNCSPETQLQAYQQILPLITPAPPDPPDNTGNDQ